MKRVRTRYPCFAAENRMKLRIALSKNDCFGNIVEARQERKEVQEMPPVYACGMGTLSPGTAISLAAHRILNRKSDRTIWVYPDPLDTNLQCFRSLQ